MIAWLDRLLGIHQVAMTVRVPERLTIERDALGRICFSTLDLPDLTAWARLLDDAREALRHDAWEALDVLDPAPDGDDA